MIPNTPVRYNRTTDRPIPPYGYKEVPQGDTLKSGDALAFGNEWIPVTPISIGATVQAYPGYIRKEAQ